MITYLVQTQELTSYIEMQFGIELAFELVQVVHWTDPKNVEVEENHGPKKVKVRPDMGVYVLHYGTREVLLRGRLNQKIGLIHSHIP